MKLNEVFYQLSVGELSQLGIVDRTTGLVPESKYPNLVSHINLGLTDLYTRFNLKERSVNFPLSASAYTYQIRAADLIKIEKVLTEFERELPLNDRSSEYSCFTPTLSTITVAKKIVDGSSDVPEQFKASSLKMVYRANHRKLPVCDLNFDPENIELELPQTHLWALLMFVASRNHNPVGMGQEFNSGNTYWQKYEAACLQLKMEGLEVDKGSQSTRFERNGWV